MNSLQQLQFALGVILAVAVVCSGEAGSPIVIGEQVLVVWPLLKITLLVPSPVPGILGNQLEGKLNKTTAPHYMCTKKTDDFITLWLAITDLLPDGEVACLSDNLRCACCPSYTYYFIGCHPTNFQHSPTPFHIRRAKVLYQLVIS